jgi:hypothetical protein
MLPRNLVVSALRLCVAVAGVSIAEAAIIHSTFSPTPPGYSAGGAFAIHVSPFPGLPPQFPQKVDWGMGFVLDQDAVADEVHLPLWFQGDLVLRVSLVEEAPTGDLGTILDSFLLSSEGDTEVEIYSGEFLSRPTLVAGQRYWLMVGIEGTETLGQVLWAFAFRPFSGLGVGPVGAISDHPFVPPVWGWSNSEQAAFRLDGQVSTAATPEPATFALSAIAVGAALIGTYLRKTHVRQDAILRPVVNRQGAK